MVKSNYQGMAASNTMIDNFEIDICHNYRFDDLQQQWLSIQDGQSLPFFLTWPWISCWLKTFDPDVIVVSASVDDRVVAIGLFTRSIQIRRGIIKSSQYRLHQVGDQLLDQIWMEFNDFICLEEYRADAVNACLQALQMSDEDCDEIILSMVTSSRARDIQGVLSEAEVQMTSASYAEDLSRLRQHDLPYLKSLTSNTRYQIRRSERLYNRLHGEVKYTLASDVQQALDFFHEAGKYHMLRWDDSGFTNPQFVAFHESLIRDSFDNRSVDMMKVTSGDETIAILYFHIVDKDVYFYLQGVNYESDQKLKPGLLAHAIATQYYLDKGMRKYDYMGGFSQYKCQLSSPSEDMVTLCIQKPSIAFSLERSGRKLKSLLTK